MAGNRGSSRSHETTGLTYAQFETMALALPGVEAGSSCGTPGLKVKKKFMARLREPGVLVLTPVYDDEQRFLMETQPEAFFLTDHYRGYPAILIRLSKVDRTQLAELLEQAWRRLAPPKLLAEQEVAASTKYAVPTLRSGPRAANRTPGVGATGRPPIRRRTR